jgi:hypothetical protein
VQLDVLQDWPLLPLLGGTLLPLRHRRLVFVLPVAPPPHEAAEQGTAKAGPAPEAAPGGQLQQLSIVDAVTAPLPALHDLVGPGPSDYIPGCQSVCRSIYRRPKAAAGASAAAGLPAGLPAALSRVLVLCASRGAAHREVVPSLPILTKFGADGCPASAPAPAAGPAGAVGMAGAHAAGAGGPPARPALRLTVRSTLRLRHPAAPRAGWRCSWRRQQRRSACCSCGRGAEQAAAFGRGAWGRRDWPLQQLGRRGTPQAAGAAGRGGA